MVMPLDPVLANLPAMPLVRGAHASESVRETIRGARVSKVARAGLYLRAGFWEEAHEIAQDLDTPEGSYWHAIVHRQEPDAGNASYWFRRVGAHAIFPELAQRAAEIEPSLDGSWDPFRFIDYCERASRQPRGETERRAIAIQDVEWELLFAHCRAAE
jgi:hypothetical protein